MRRILSLKLSIKLGINAAKNFQYSIFNKIFIQNDL